MIPTVYTSSICSEFENISYATPITQTLKLWSRPSCGCRACTRGARIWGLCFLSCTWATAVPRASKCITLTNLSVRTECMHTQSMRDGWEYHHVTLWAWHTRWLVLTRIVWYWEKALPRVVGERSETTAFGKDDEVPVTQVSSAISDNSSSIAVLGQVEHFIFSADRLILRLRLFPARTCWFLFL